MNSKDIQRYIALDIHKEYVLAGGQNAKQEWVLPSYRISMAKFHEWATANLQEGDAVVLETTTNVWDIYDTVAPLATKTVVAHAGAVRQIAEARVKTDKEDVKRLFRLLIADIVPEVWVPPVEVRELRAFVSATGSAGTLGAGDYLKQRYGAKIVAVEALECPTLLYNGFGEHNIQGIGDKHIPLIHNVMNTDVVVAVSDRTTDALGVLFDEEAGKRHLAARGVPAEVLAHLPALGLSSICNVVAAIKTAKRLGLGEEDVIVTVATDGAAMYASERAKVRGREFAGGFDASAADAVFTDHLLGADTAHTLPLRPVDQTRIFNLGYFTWVEQQGVPLVDFVARREQSFWRGLRALLPAWDAAIDEFNGRTGLA